MTKTTPTPFKVAALAATLALAAASLAQTGSTRMVRRELAYPTGDRATSVVLLQRVAPETVRMGQPYEYTVTITNLTQTEVKEVVLTEEIAANLQVARITPQPTSRDGNRVSWSFATLGPRQSVEVRIAGTPSEMAEIICCATVTFKTLVCGTTRVVQPALELVKQTPPEVVICEPIPVRLVVSNPGSGLARNVVINDPLPEGWTTRDGQRVISIDVGDLPAGQSREYTVEVRAARTGQFTNSATAREAGGLTADASSSTVVRKPELAVTKSCPQYRYVGRPATFEITVTNTGDAVARDTVVLDQLPAGTELVGVGQNGRLHGREVRWSLGDLAPGQSKTVTMTVKLTRRGNITNTAFARAYCAEGQASCTLESRGIPAILLEVVDLQDPVEVGTTTTYLITVLNQGSADGTNIVIECELPPEESFVSADGPTAHELRGRKVHFAPLPSLAPKARVSYRVVVKGEAVGDVRFRVSLNSDQMRSSADETESTHIY